MTCSTEKKAFKPGETAKIACWFDNATSRTATPVAKLCAKQVYYSNSRSHRKTLTTRLAVVKGDPVAAHTSDVQAELNLPIPSKVSLTVSNCSILDVEYFIEVRLGVKGPHFDLIVLFPIILCEIPEHNHPPLYY
ncbi:arrestin domain-containing protein 2-like isoform X3 [Kryptolebias marmoratus]|uniref:arrestin domain-containing protein 2-like isoform X3 n=1 Tax=Kryptolebias marmoratus TaxID=37003 RepID=UPI0007F8DD71|nr:arrestin domain-containing protein 2-like isoform X3 [Kryptolebias marmoratus]XP_024861158.1 arrestin domain-containing protein 2-like isoform X3 [Kryptolebias marmoratus]XP_037834320.1 arrestin domain-containing protein 2-like isoform X3 [Kryptolebias marmoratus]XP_037834321.1 arrestin domain-containing protein 2-like isoform X3 [Kryptolebias marmoratus]